ncbi:MAG: hypothetical protein QOI20_3250 [Acidimicrobiaceae bacterium]|jgi:hypothetical protein|nr:hypothetical protein [Acidimicrobiaceae bacterium]
MPITDIDYVRRDVPRTLPVKLHDRELLEIARAKAKKERHVAKKRADMQAESKKRKAEIESEQKQVEAMAVELDTGAQLREVLTEEIWRDGMVHAIRLDTMETFEKRSPTISEQQRRLPVQPNGNGKTGTLPLLDQARAKQTDTDEDEGVDDDASPDSNVKKRRGKKGKG